MADIYSIDFNAAFVSWLVSMIPDATITVSVSDSHEYQSPHRPPLYSTILKMYLPLVPLTAMLSPRNVPPPFSLYLFLPTTNIQRTVGPPPLQPRPTPLRPIQPQHRSLSLPPRRTVRPELHGAGRRPEHADRGESQLEEPDGGRVRPVHVHARGVCLRARGSDCEWLGGVLSVFGVEGVCCCREGGILYWIV